VKRNIEELKNNHFDILVIGGGINGCAIARDASLRGAKTSLIEKNDFASGASGKSTKLIHGGIRYLEQLNFKFVYEALHERTILLKTVPHLVRPLEFIIPVYKNDPRSLLKMRSGVFIYDCLARGEKIRSHRYVRSEDFVALEPNIELRGLKGAVTYYDAQVDDVRLCLANAVSSYEAGCCVANKVEAKGLIKEKGKVCGVHAQDMLSKKEFIIRARAVINATGAWSNSIVKMDSPSAPLITRPTKGVHIVYKKLPVKRAVLFSARKDARVCFVIPWRGLTLIGTTDTDYTGSCDEVYATAAEIEYLLSEVRRIFPGENIEKDGIITTYASLRPLANTQEQPTWKISRESLIQESESGLISVAGGKYTTYRRLAEKVVDMALLRFKGRVFQKCITSTTGPYLPVLEGDDKDSGKLVERATREEMANTLIDLFVRRLQLFVTPSLGLERVEECAMIMASILEWSQEQKESEIRAYKEEIRKNANFY